MSILFHASAAGQESILVTESKIHLSTLYHPEINDFEKSLETAQPGESIQTWEMSDITGLTYLESELEVVNALSNNRIVKLKFADSGNLKLYVQYIATIQNFSSKKEPLDTFEMAVWQLLYMSSFLILSFVAIYQSINNECKSLRCIIPDSVDASWIRMVAIVLAIFGIILAFYFAYRAWKIHKNPPHKIWYN